MQDLPEQLISELKAGRLPPITDELIDYVLARIPKRKYMEIIGLKKNSQGSLNKQADNYGLPLRADDFGHLDVADILLEFHKFLAKKANILKFETNLKDDDPLMQGKTTANLEKYRGEKYKIIKMHRMELEGSIIKKQDCREWLMRLAGFIRKAGNHLQKEYGPDAQKLLDEALEQFESVVVESLGEKAKDGE
jgi:hypothetical protein